jgi:hypothetical protein
MVAAMDLVALGTAMIVEAEFGLGLAQQELLLEPAACSPRSPCGQVNIDDGVAEGGDDSSRGKLGLEVYRCTYLSCYRSHEGCPCRIIADVLTYQI